MPGLRSSSGASSDSGGSDAASRPCSVRMRSCTVVSSARTRLGLAAGRELAARVHGAELVDEPHLGEAPLDAPAVDGGDRLPGGAAAGRLGGAAVQPPGAQAGHVLAEARDVQIGQVRYHQGHRRRA